MLPPFEGKESEHNWQLRERAINRVRGMLKGDVHIRFTDAFMEGLKGGFMTNSLKTVSLFAPLRVESDFKSLHLSVRRLRRTLVPSMWSWCML